MNIDTLRWKKYPVLNDGFICLVDAMGDDSSIVQAARVSYGKDDRLEAEEQEILSKSRPLVHSSVKVSGLEHLPSVSDIAKESLGKKDRALIRYLLNHSHTTPFEMVELKFLVRVPMDCWRQWIRHRTANVNEYSTRYTEAIDSQQTTRPDQWRLQATDNKQGSSGYLTPELPEGCDGQLLTTLETNFHDHARSVYQTRLRAGIAKEQARKDLPLSTYTEAYWKCDLHNIFNFLRLRMDSHAQYEIRMYANAMAEIVKQIVPVAWEAFEDYVLYAKKFSRMEMEVLKQIVEIYRCQLGEEAGGIYPKLEQIGPKPSSMTDREWKEFLAKLS